MDGFILFARPCSWHVLVRDSVFRSLLTAGPPPPTDSSFVPETPAQKSRTRRRTDSGTAVVRESPDAKGAGNGRRTEAALIGQGTVLGRGAAVSAPLRSLVLAWFAVVLR